MEVKFAHISDCHLGGWREENLNQIGYLAFERTIDKIIEEKLDFVIISGDLYDVSNPKVDVVDLATRELKRLNEHNIPVYGIMGSHDFSPSDKSMIRPLISAEFFINVSRSLDPDSEKIKLDFTEDHKTGIKLTGLRARKRSLEIEDFKELDLNHLKEEPGPKIFVFHTMLSELKPKEFRRMNSAPKSYLPKDFLYYAGGHLHKTLPERLKEEKEFIIENNSSNIIYPGCLTPVNFKEIEKLHYGGFCIVSGEIDSDLAKSQLLVKYVPIKIKDVITLRFDCNNKSLLDAKKMIDEKLTKINPYDKIVTIRIFGTLSSGRAYDISNNKIITRLKKKGAYSVLINKSALTSKEYTSVSVKAGKTNEEIENTLIKEHAQKINLKEISKDAMENNIHKLLDLLGKEKEVGEKVKDYENRLINEFEKIFNIEESLGED